MVDLSKLMQNAAILEVIDKSADEASSLSAQNSYQAMRIEELERELADEKCQSHKNAVEAMCLEAEIATLKALVPANAWAWKERAVAAEAERDALLRDMEHWAEYWNGNENERAMTDALHYIIGQINTNLAAKEGP